MPENHSVIKPNLQRLPQRLGRTGDGRRRRQRRIDIARKLQTQAAPSCWSLVCWCSVLVCPRKAAGLKRESAAASSTFRGLCRCARMAAVVPVPPLGTINEDCQPATHNWAMPGQGDVSEERRRSLAKWRILKLQHDRRIHGDFTAALRAMGIAQSVGGTTAVAKLNCSLLCLG